MRQLASALGFATAIVTLAPSVRPVQAQGAPIAAAREAAYAARVSSVADSAIHRLDFFPSRAQLRLQLLFLAPPDSTAMVFGEIARRGTAAAQRVDEIAADFEQTPVPDDLTKLHADLVASLHAARSALDRLALSANNCLADATSITRCQTPLTGASSAVTQAYQRYLSTRARIREQIRDTRTELAKFSVRVAP
jgi:hypothetical protein